MNEMYTENRKKFFKLMKDNSMLALFAGDPPIKRGDEFYPFSPQRNFYYLTGIERPGLILVMTKKGDKETAALFLERRDEVNAKWVGEVMTRDEAKAVSGIEEFKYLDEFYGHAANLIFSGGYKSVYADLENRHWDRELSPDVKFAGKLKKRFPAVELLDAYALFTELRLIKSPAETDLLRKAIAITGEGIELMMKKARPGMKEYEIEAHFNFTLRKSGVKDNAFASIAAAGKNATVLHYVDNDCEAKDGDLILFDVGAKYGHYSADISRTFPVNGTFTPRQRQLYDIVLRANEMIICMIKPGVEFSSLNKAVKEYYAVELKKIGLIDKEEDVSKYYYHGVSHWLGLETHDIGRGKEDVLRPGMVLTVEPGLYIGEEGIGIRIEDDALVTETGCDVLSKDIIKDAEDIERFMAGDRH